MADNHTPTVLQSAAFVRWVDLMTQMVSSLLLESHRPADAAALNQVADELVKAAVKAATEDDNV